MKSSDLDFPTKPFCWYCKVWYIKAQDTHAVNQEKKKKFYKKSNKQNGSRMRELRLKFPKVSKA